MSRSWKRALGVLAALVLPLVLPLLVGANILRWSGALYQLAGSSQKRARWQAFLFSKAAHFDT
jgi:hypothetical protein